AAALKLIGTPNLFKDLTGLDLNQQNAAKAFQSALQTAQFFGGKAADLAQQQFLNKDMDRTLKSIGDAKKKGLLTDDQAQKLTESALRGSVGDRRPAESRPTSSPAVQRFLDKAATSKSSEVSVSRPEGSVSVKSGDRAGGQLNRNVEPAVPFIPQPNPLTCWAAAAAMMYCWKRRSNFTIADVMTR